MSPAEDQSLFPPQRKYWSVGYLTAVLRDAIEPQFKDVWVQGELSNCKRHTSGHWYFTLKEKTIAQIKGAMWKTQAEKLRFPLEDGMKVLIQGSLSVYAPNGDYKVIAQSIVPDGVGPAQLAFRELYEKLQVKGWFAEERKKPIPFIPRCIGLVTSKTGAVVRDVLRIIERRWPATKVWVVPAHMQGDLAVSSIIKALTIIHQLEQKPEVVILARGGGSSEDLLPFNQELLAKAIFRCHMPVISAVGHETDVTIADLVADWRAATPSEAAERAVPDREELARHLTALRQKLHRQVSDCITSGKQQAARLAAHRFFRKPMVMVEEKNQQVDDLESRLHKIMKSNLANLKEKLARKADLLTVLNPLQVLSRGYSITMTLPDKRAVTDPTKIEPGQMLISHVHQGSIISKVESVSKERLSDQ